MALEIELLLLFCVRKSIVNLRVELKPVKTVYISFIRMSITKVFHNVSSVNSIVCIIQSVPLT